MKIFCSKLPLSYNIGRTTWLREALFVSRRKRTQFRSLKNGHLALRTIFTRTVWQKSLVFCSPSISILVSGWEDWVSPVHTVGRCLCVQVPIPLRPIPGLGPRIRLFFRLFERQDSTVAFPCLYFLIWIGMYFVRYVRGVSRLVGLGILAATRNHDIFCRNIRSHRIETG